MGKKETGGPAYPGYFIDDDGEELYQNGMTLRDYFAGQGAIAIMSQIERGRCVMFDEVATGAYGLADAMLKERSK